jgi:hypothetical protein
MQSLLAFAKTFLGKRKEAGQLLSNTLRVRAFALILAKYDCRPLSLLIVRAD